MPGDAREAGLSLVEMLVVLAIIGVLAGSTVLGIGAKAFSVELRVLAAREPQLRERFGKRFRASVRGLCHAGTLHRAGACP